MIKMKFLQKNILENYIIPYILNYEYIRSSMYSQLITLSKWRFFMQISEEQRKALLKEVFGLSEVGERREDWLKKTCEKCSGDGTILHTVVKSVPCSCEDGRVTLSCKYCDGTGKFTQRRGSVVDCYACNGTGIWRVVRCKTCRGKGEVSRKSKVEHTCFRCKGEGKVKVEPFNPVLDLEELIG